MPDSTYMPPIRVATRPKRGRLIRLAVLAGAVVGGVVVAAVATSPAEAGLAVQAAGPELTRLLRAMAGLKLLFAAGLLAATAWRLEAPAPAWRLAAYAAAASAMAAGPMLIWDMAHLRLGALLLHGGLLAGVLLLWRDPAMGRRLADTIAARRAILRAR